jgi:hypothetical protein
MKPLLYTARRDFVWRETCNDSLFTKSWRVKLAQWRMNVKKTEQKKKNAPKDKRKKLRIGKQTIKDLEPQNQSSPKGGLLPIPKPKPGSIACTIWTD